MPKMLVIVVLLQKLNSPLHSKMFTPIVTVFDHTYMHNFVLFLFF